MRVVIDSNVWVSGLILPDSVPGLVIHAVRVRRLTAVVSWELVRELTDVLRRPRIRRYGVTEEDIRTLLLLLGPLLPRVDLAVELRDPNDVPVVGAAVVGRAEAIVTGDRDILDDGPLRAWLSDRGIDILTPTEVLARLEGHP